MWCRNLESPRLEGTVDGIVLNALNYIVGFMNNRYAALSSQKKQFLSLALCFQWGFVVVKMALFSFYKMGTTIMFYPLEERFRDTTQVQTQAFKEDRLQKCLR